MNEAMRHVPNVVLESIATYKIVENHEYLHNKTAQQNCTTKLHNKTAQQNCCAVVIIVYR